MNTPTDTAVPAAETIDAAFKHILLPMDPAQPNVAAACYARQIAGWGDSQITLLSVRARAEDADAAGGEMHAEVTRVLEGLRTQQAVVEGDPAAAIIEYTREHGVDLIVMPTRAAAAIRRFLLGSVTAKVLDEAACPVLTFINDKTTAPPEDFRFRKIACAIDLGPDSLQTIRWAGAIAERSGASLSILHGSPQLEPVIGMVHDDEWRAHLGSLLRTEIEKLREEAAVDATVHLAGGEPARMVAEMSTEVGADLIVIGRRRRGLLGRLRTHSYGIVSQAPCPVLSV